MQLIKVCAGHPSNGIHVALEDPQRKTPPSAEAMCGEKLRNALWLRHSNKPVTCNDCKVAAVNRFGRKERKSESPSTGTSA